MKLKWMGENRDLIDSIFHFANTYASHYKTPFSITEDVALSASEIQVIEYLLENEEHHRNMAGVARCLGVSPSAFTVTVSRLEKRGLLEKYYTSSNRKNVIVLVSKEGRRVYASYSQQLQALWQKPVLDRLSQIPPVYLAQFEQVLRALAASPADVPDAPGVAEDTLIPLESPRR